MANFRGHTTFNLGAALPITTLGILYFLDPPRSLVWVYVACFVYSTLFMSPDMDLAHQIRLNSLRGVLTLPFRGYSLLFRHRGLSHHLFLGTLTRVVWLFGAVILVNWIYTQKLLRPEDWLPFFQEHQLELKYGFAGLFVADAAHLWMDR